MSKILANEIANYGDNAPIDLKEGLNIPAGKPIQVAGSAGTSGQILSTTGTSVGWITPFDGDYNSLTNRPTIPPAQIQSDWNATSGLGVVLNKPAVPPLPSVTVASPAAQSTLTYNSANGEFTYTPPAGVGTDTLADVTGRGASTSQLIEANGGIDLSVGSSLTLKNASNSSTLGIYQPNTGALNTNPSAYIAYSGTADLRIQGPVRFTTIPVSGQSSYTKADFTNQVTFNYTTYSSSFTRYQLDAAGTNIYGNLSILDDANGASNVSIAGGLTVEESATLKFNGVTRIETTATGVSYSNHQHNFAGDVTIVNDKKLIVGSNTDLEIYHNETQQNNNIVSPRDLNISVPSGTTFTSGNVTIVDSLTAGGLTYPTSNGTAGQVLTSDGAGNVLWSAAAGGGSGIALTDLSVTTNAAGSAALTYNNVSGVFTYTPPDLSSYAQTANLSIANWDAAYGWGNHATAGYLTAEADTLQTVTARGATTNNAIRVNNGAGNQVFNLDSSTGRLTIGSTAYSFAAGITMYHGSTGSTATLTMNAQSGTIDCGSLTTDTIQLNSGNLTTTGRLYYANQFPLLTDLQAVSASTYHGMFAHAHDTGHGYFAHAGGWTQLLDTGSSLNELADVTTATPNTNDVLTWDGSNWGPAAPSGGSGGASVTISDTPPAASTGDLWWESDTGRLKIYYQDTDSSQWVDTSPPLSVDNINDVVTANGFKFRLNEATPPAGTLGELRQIDSRPHFYDGTNWQEFILASTEVATIPAETAWDNVIIRTTFDNDVNDLRFGATGVVNNYAQVADSTRVASPVKFGTNALQSVGDGVQYANRAEYDFTGEFTIECWIYFDSANISTGQNSGEQIVISKQNSAQANGWALLTAIDVNGNRSWKFRYRDTSTATNVTLTVENQSGVTWNSVYLQDWVHIALTRDSNGALHFYRNGTESILTSGGTSFANGIDSNTESIMFGGSKYSTINMFDGYIDDIRVTTDVRYTGNFTPPATAHPISGATTTYTPPATSKAGEITLGTTPTWTGTLGVTVSQQISGTYRMTFANAFTNATDYYVFANPMDYPGGQVVFVKTNRSAGYIDFVIYRDGDGNPVDQGSLAVQVIAH